MIKRELVISFNWAYCIFYLDLWIYFAIENISASVSIAKYILWIWIFLTYSLNFMEKIFFYHFDQFIWLRFSRDFTKWFWLWLKYPNSAILELQTRIWWLKKIESNFGFNLMLFYEHNYHVMPKKNSDFPLSIFSFSNSDLIFSNSAKNTLFYN